MATAAASPTAMPASLAGPSGIAASDAAREASRASGAARAQGHQGAMGGGNGRGIGRGPSRRVDDSEVRFVIPLDRVDRLKDGELHDRAPARLEDGVRRRHRHGRLHDRIPVRDRVGARGGSEGRGQRDRQRQTATLRERVSSVSSNIPFTRSALG